jgi:hypothetical protein
MPEVSISGILRRLELLEAKFASLIENAGAPMQDTALPPDSNSNDDDPSPTSNSSSRSIRSGPAKYRPLACPDGPELPTTSSREPAPILVAKPATELGPVSGAEGCD